MNYSTDLRIFYSVLKAVVNTNFNLVFQLF